MYEVSNLRLDEFFRRLEFFLEDRDLHRSGALMGVGMAYRRPSSGLLGTIKGDPIANEVKMEISILRKSAYTYMIMTAFLGAPAILLIAYLARIGILPPLPSLVVFFIALFALFLTLLYEFTMGILPASRRRRKELENACDIVISAMSGTPKTKWKMEAENVRMKKNVWRFGGMPDKVDPSEFLLDSGSSVVN